MPDSADEPTGRLDAATGAAVLALLRDVVRTEGTTAVVSTHDDRVAGAADRTLRLVDSRLAGAAGTGGAQAAAPSLPA